MSVLGNDHGSVKSVAQDAEIQVVPDINPKDEAKVLAKLDLFLTPILFVVYLSCFIDRANIGNRTTLLTQYRAC